MGSMRGQYGTNTSKTPLSQIYPKSIPEASGKHLGIGWSWCPISLLECWQCIFAAIHSLCRNRSQRTEKSYLSVSGTQWDSQFYPKFWDTFPTSMSRPPLYHSCAASPRALVSRPSNTSPESNHAGHARVVLLGFGGEGEECLRKRTRPRPLAQAAVCHAVSVAWSMYPGMWGLEGRRVNERRRAGERELKEVLMRHSRPGWPIDPPGVRIWALNDALPEGQLATPHL
jgi:hypothetical protein